MFQWLPDSTGWGCQLSVPGASAPHPAHCLLQEGLTQKDTELSDRAQPRVSYRPNGWLASQLTILLQSQNVFGLWLELCSFYPQIYKFIYTMFALSSYCLFKIRKLSFGKKETYPFEQTGRSAVTSRSVSPSYFCLQTGSWPHSRPCRGTWTSFTSRHPLSSPSNHPACLRVSSGSQVGPNNAVPGWA